MEESWPVFYKACFTKFDKIITTFLGWFMHLKNPCLKLCTLILFICCVLGYILVTTTQRSRQTNVRDRGHICAGVTMQPEMNSLVRRIADICTGERRRNAKKHALFLLRNITAHHLQWMKLFNLWNNKLGTVTLISSWGWLLRCFKSTIFTKMMVPWAMMSLKSFKR